SRYACCRQRGAQCRCHGRRGVKPAPQPKHTRRVAGTCVVTHFPERSVGIPPPLPASQAPEGLDRLRGAFAVALTERRHAAPQAGRARPRPNPTSASPPPPPSPSPLPPCPCLVTSRKGSRDAG